MGGLGMSRIGSDASFARAAASYDNQSPDEMSDEDERIAEWLKECPVSLSNWDESQIERILSDSIALQND